VCVCVCVCVLETESQSQVKWLHTARSRRTAHEAMKERDEEVGLVVVAATPRGEQTQKHSDQAQMQTLIRC
jgi:hypothetical protein